jgi:hypothetical protein
VLASALAEIVIRQGKEHETKPVGTLAVDSVQNCITELSLLNVSWKTGK